LTRSHQFRISSFVYIAKGTTADEVISTSKRSEFFITDVLKGFSDNTGINSSSHDMMIYELMGDLDNEQSGVLIPALSVYEVESEDEEKTKKPVLKLDGYAVFKKTKLVGYTELTEALGINYILNRVEGATLNIVDSDNKAVSLEITNPSCKVIPEIKDETVKVKIKAENHIKCI
jgi:spore germination protein KC